MTLEDTPLKRSLSFLDTLDRREKMLELFKCSASLSAMEDEHKIPTNQVKGCVAIVHVHGRIHHGTMEYQGDADSKLLRGYLSVLIEGMNGSTPEEIQRIPLDILRQIGFQQALIPSRNNGLRNILQHMKAIAATQETGLQP